jgi:hypothetical protein
MSKQGYRQPCECGCGDPVLTSTARFLRGHNGRRSIVERFWEKVDRRSDDECWPWMAALGGDGYGLLGRGGGKSVLAHRFSYEFLVGAVPEGLQLDHLCHTADSSCAGGRSCTHRRCVNPAHLEPVTSAVNKARGVRARLTAETAAEIRALAPTTTVAALARQYGVGWTTVSHVIAGRTWRDEFEVRV